MTHMFTRPAFSIAFALVLASACADAPVAPPAPQSPVIVRSPALASALTPGWESFGLKHLFKTRWEATFEQPYDFFYFESNANTKSRIGLRNSDGTEFSDILLCEKGAEVCQDICTRERTCDESAGEGFVRFERELPFNLVSVRLDPIFDVDVRITSDVGSVDKTTDEEQTIVLNWKEITWFRIEVLPNKPGDWASVARVTAVNFEVDPTPPTLTLELTGTKGDNNWYVSEVAWRFEIVDRESPLWNALGTPTEEGGYVGDIKIADPRAPLVHGGVRRANGEHDLEIDVASWGGDAYYGYDIPRVASFRIDVTKPTIELSGNKGTYKTTEAISITCRASDWPSGIATQCEDYNKAAGELRAGSRIIQFKATDNAGNVTEKNVTLNIVDPDRTPPEVTPVVTGTLGKNGWYTSKTVTLTWRVSDGESAISHREGCDPSEVVADEVATFTCTATSEGGKAPAVVVTVAHDATPPAITFAGPRLYTADQTLALSCTPSDPTSGIDNATCPGASGPAYESVGTKTVDARAANRAGLETKASTSYTVTVTTGSMFTLITRFVTGKGLKTLTSRMENVQDKIAKRSPSLDEQIKNFLKELERAEVDGNVSSPNAATLATLIRTFSP